MADAPLTALQKLAAIAGERTLVVRQHGKGRIDLGTQDYELVDAALLPNREGQPCVVLMWRAHCATCGVAFEVRGSIRCIHKLSRRCKAHRHRPVAQDGSAAAPEASVGV